MQCVSGSADTRMRIRSNDPESQNSTKLMPSVWARAEDWMAQSPELKNKKVGIDMGDYLIKLYCWFKIHNILITEILDSLTAFL